MSVMQPHRVLFIPELLQNILSFMDRADNVFNACVCKQWSEIALDLIWREVNDLPRLLGLLRPCQRRGASTDFDGQPDSRDWARFQKYADRVRTLRYQQGIEDYSSMLDDMARTRTKLEMLPNLHTLEWLFEDIYSMERATLFMHQRVRHLVISAPPLQLPTKSSFFVDIYARMPHLHTIDLRVPYAASVIEADILELLRSLPHLKKVIFPEFYFTSNILSELSRMKHINIVQFEHGPEQGLGEEKDVVSFAPVLEQGAFPVLWDLAITARLGDVTRFMNADFAPINITSLYLSTYIEHEPEQVHAFLVTLSQKCRLLSQLYIKLLHVRGHLMLIPAKQITFDTLRPVLSLPNLTTFEVMHKYPVNITLEEIEELASRWPSLESLALNEEPLVMFDFTLDLRALVPFARHCPKLRRLALFMDATTAKIHPTQELKPFTALSILSVGTSQAHDSDAVAAFLSHLCPAGCELEIGITWTAYGSRSCRELENGVLLEINRRFTPWEIVKDLLPVLIQLRREEREKSKALQEEVEDLRTRNRLLMDKVNIKADDSCIIV
ncbi:hypothetical protein K503DRAFT_719480 [Rhizopogon vinicolor AM-OR11-026]|uniref:F-box domain-containing protein n=1 Tax=Rhizopogon vinicolor AM-OR11-026 TaxID=1314800 RepID=A0A1B7MYE5_9AGAM|nr:hypothetical protein K503DRAFT_719480 [Rhizopogon vinicolor AM-OR11-026]